MTATQRNMRQRKYGCYIFPYRVDPRSAKIWIATWSGLRGTTYHHYKQPSTILYCGSGRRWGAGGNKSSSPPLSSSAQHSLDIPESSTPQACGVLNNERIRSPTRVEVDSSLYLESPDDALLPPPKKLSLFNYLLLVAITNTSIVFVKKKLMGNNDENFSDILVFLGTINLGLSFLFFVLPFFWSSFTSWWGNLSKGHQAPMEVTVSPPPRLPEAPPREQEAPPPPYHIAVDSSTPPPSYFDIFDK
ncbi:hypothetical protein GE061_002786 [Apolygus lucorum]|uniref:Uncharacterized protein n=1 Tax=Apolygus lucorum TaxID=248454 RepID=A0A8S9XA66_APOLU|nr:hypothetical protein GE061_002786 [Apolygus lucorum]